MSKAKSRVRALFFAALLGAASALAPQTNAAADTATDARPALNANAVSFQTLCRFKHGLTAEKRRTVDAIVEWARVKHEAKGCAAAERALKSSQTIEIEDAGLTWLSPLAQAREARRLHLAGNRFSDASPLAGLSKVEVLDVRGSPLASLPAALLAHVRVLNVSGTRLFDFASIAAAISLQDLNMHNVGLQTLDGLERFAALMSLGVTDNRLSRLDGIENLPELRYLYVSGNALTDLSAAANVPLLRLLHARGNPLERPTACPHPYARCVFDDE